MDLAVGAEKSAAGIIVFPEKIGNDGTGFACNNVASGNVIGLQTEFPVTVHFAASGPAAVQCG